MNFLRALFVTSLMAAIPARAIYAPLPDQAEGRTWSTSLRSGVAHDSNIFGAARDEISSVVYSFSPRVVFKGAVSDQTFASFVYALTLDHFADRPGDRTLDSHDVFARLVHAFGPATQLDISDQYLVSRNPESLLAGLPVNTNQSFARNQLDARFLTKPRPKLGVTLKARSVSFDYENPALGAELDRNENLYGVSGSHALRPGLDLVLEYRREDVLYRVGGARKDKQSDFLIGGFDYAIARKLGISSRFGPQWRSRSAEPSTSGIYVEISGKYDYAPRSFLTGGYVHTVEESSNIAVYNDTKVNRWFVNVQHAVSALVVASLSATYEPSELQGRRGVADVDETTTRLGAALTWLPTPRWSFSASYDHDEIDSDDPVRGQSRDRVGVSAGYTF